MTLYADGMANYAEIKNVRIEEEEVDKTVNRMLCPKDQEDCDKIFQVNEESSSEEFLKMKPTTQLTWKKLYFWQEKSKVQRLKESKIMVKQEKKDEDNILE